MWDEFLKEKQMAGIVKRLEREQRVMSNYLESYFLVYCYPPVSMITLKKEEEEVCPECGQDL